MPIQIDGEHQAYISLNTDKLITSQKKEIPISPIMEGHAEIFLNDKTIFKRIFNSLF
ncbi:MAG: hypothetical protein LBE82_02590 [Chitinophagaceae bacterium]|nr:hypothetical protein [Chitinophagaceae bacterium]